MYISTFLPLLKPSQSQVTSNTSQLQKPALPVAQWGSISNPNLAQTQGSERNRT